MRVHVRIVDAYGDRSMHKSVGEILAENIALLAKLYDVDLLLLPKQRVMFWIWRRSAANVTTEMQIAYNINNEICFELYLSCPDNLSVIEVLLADEFMGYIAFCAVMACKPKRLDDVGELITYYTLKYGYTGKDLII